MTSVDAAAAAFERSYQTYRSAQRAGNLSGVSDRAMHVISLVWPMTFTGRGSDWEMEIAEHALLGAHLMADVGSEDDRFLGWALQAIRVLRDSACQVAQA